MNGIFKTDINEDLVLYQKTGGLTFGTDAYLLYAYMKTLKNSIAVDLGSGTGVISLLAASKGKFSKIHSVEIQPEFCELINLNLKENKLSDKIDVHMSDVCALQSGEFGTEVDVVFTNPPYMKSDSGKSNEADIKNIARHEVNGTIDDFTACASRLLKFGGYFYAVYRPDRLIDLICAMRKYGLEPKRMTYVYYTKDAKPSLVLTEAKKGASPSLFLTKPLIISEDGVHESDDIKFIYENGEFNEQYKKS